MSRLLLPALLAGTLLGACASFSDGVLTLNDGTMRIVKEQGLGFAGDPAAMEAEVRKQAQAHCETSGMDIEVLSLSATRPPYVLGNFPRASIDFRCKPRT